ncbi:iron ABC transporter permease [Gracilibacillus sp. YIM 98692]|uniref:FecCD family ABC transporter permease n=1 Tax=Gracilibacillus sp. YIM 98692 TaxID=2663532 RepID=UPI0013D3DCE3|nr:iron ABC transporter permease [Gracilibacillus sp. YIM 98692]
MLDEKEKSVPYTIKLIIAALFFVIIFIAAIWNGAANVNITDLWHLLRLNPVNDQVIMLRDLRVPREVGAIFVGASLTVAGAIMQGLTRNPLADPGLLGLTAGANLALAITIAFIPDANYMRIMIACIIGAAVGTVLVVGIGSMRSGGFSPFRIVLAGAAISAFLSAIAEGFGIYFKVAKDVSMWTAGGLIGTTWGQLQIVVPFMAAGIVMSLLLSKQLTLLTFSEDVAIGLGQKTLKIKIALFGIIIVLAGTAVALVGNMAFIGLMIPHIVRAIVGTDYRYILPMSVFIGASFMLMADTAARTISAPYETPVAAIVSIMGLPFFLYLIRKGGNGIS